MNVIGLVGPFGSGCTCVAKILEEKHSYKYISLSDILRDKYLEIYPELDDNRSSLQDFGDEYRKQNGSNILAKLAIERMDDTNANYVVDSIRNPEEIKELRNSFANFYLIGVFADNDIRYERVKGKYNDDRRLFDKDDKRDSGEKSSFGQQVTNSFRQADLVILNNDTIRNHNKVYNNLIAKIKENIDIIDRIIPFRPNPHETYMAMAYAVSMRSSCLKRRVGAVIVDESGSIFSSGYNEVPRMQKTCLEDYGMCYRDSLKAGFKQSLNEELKNDIMADNVYGNFKKNFKILDYCRALHAEENAIVNVAKSGSTQLGKAHLYTTTYPCNLCANKIVQVGIKNVVYFEPYPMEEAKKILQAGNVNQIPFEGVTYNGYFRLMEVVE